MSQRGEAQQQKGMDKHKKISAGNQTLQVPNTSLNRLEFLQTQAVTIQAKKRVKPQEKRDTRPL
jgi:hypothetical protein